MPLCCLLPSPLQTSYSCDTWLAVGHRGNLHPPKLQQVHRGAESALTLRAVTTPFFYNFCFLMSNVLSVVSWLRLKLVVPCVNDMMYIKFDQRTMLEMSLFFLPSFHLLKVFSTCRHRHNVRRWECSSSHQEINYGPHIWDWEHILGEVCGISAV